jgi:hypothetical protein
LLIGRLLEGTNPFVPYCVVKESMPAHFRCAPTTIHRCCLMAGDLVPRVNMYKEGEARSGRSGKGPDVAMRGRPIDCRDLVCALYIIITLPAQ